MKKSGMKSKKNTANTMNSAIENDDRTPKKSSLAVNREVPGNPIVTRVVTRAIYQSTGVEPATPEMKKKSRV